MRTDTTTSIPQGGQTVKAPKKSPPAAQPPAPPRTGADPVIHQSHLDQTINAGGARRNGG